MDRARLDGWLEKGILGIVILILVVGPLIFGSARLGDFQIVQGLTAVAVLLWAIRLWTRQEYRVLWPPLAWVVAVFLGYVVWHYTRADVEYVARMELNKIIVYCALFFVILDSLNRQEWSQALVITLVVMGMVMSMYAVYQYITESKFIYNTAQPQGYWGRAGGPFVCPNHLAGYLAMVVPLALALAVAGRFNVVTKVLLGYAAVVMLAGVYVTVSRGGWVATAIGLAAFFGVLLFRPGFRLAAIVMLVLLLAGGFWFGAKNYRMKQRVNAALKNGDVQNDRFYVWEIATEIWRENYWLGAGPAHFDLRFRELRPPLQQLQVRPMRVHNDYLNTLADWGLIGMSIIAGGVAIFWIGVLRIWRFVKRSNEFGAKQSTRAAIVLGGSAGLIALSAHSFVDFNMHIPANGIVAMTLLAVVTGHWRFATERFWVNPRVVGRALATILALAGVGWLSVQAARTYKAQEYLGRAQRSPELSTERLEWLRKAAEAEPMDSLTLYDLGDAIRRMNWNRASGIEQPAAEAMELFKRSTELDKYNPYGPLGMGMCLHWLGRNNEAWPWFRRMIIADRNSYYMRAHFAWHLLQFGAFEQALRWFESSLALNRVDNQMALAYWEITRRRAEEAAQLRKALETGAGNEGR